MIGNDAAKWKRLLLSVREYRQLCKTEFPEQVCIMVLEARAVSPCVRGLPNDTVLTDPVVFLCSVAPGCYHRRRATCSTSPLSPRSDSALTSSTTVSAQS